VNRLDFFIHRMTAQRDCLALAARLITDVPGPVLKLGLFNRRTYDHLREILPGREIFVFDRCVAAHPDCVPDNDHMIVGDITETLAGAGAVIGAKAALAHCDTGMGVEPFIEIRGPAAIRPVGAADDVDEAGHGSIFAEISSGSEPATFKF